MKFTPQEITDGLDLTPFFESIDQKLPTFEHFEQSLVALDARQRILRFHEDGKADLNEFIDCLVLLHSCDALPERWAALIGDDAYVTCRIIPLAAWRAEEEKGGEK